MVRRHRRFALRDVTLGGEPVGGATIDAWEDDAGHERWAARTLIPVRLHPADGTLVGTMRDGSRVSGDVRVGDNHGSPNGARVVLVNLYGTGPLTGDDGERRAG